MLTGFCFGMVSGKKYSRVRSTTSFQKAEIFEAKNNYCTEFLSYSMSSINEANDNTSK
jgi:hypothetical protein